VLRANIFVLPFSFEQNSAALVKEQGEMGNPQADLAAQPNAGEVWMLITRKIMKSI
jgi:hypothetical protein